jgi:hypothetical protein
MDLNHDSAIEYFTGAELLALSLSKRGIKGENRKSQKTGTRGTEGLRSVSRPGEEK